jgi:transcriptional regulator with XRE-family HTH domain
MTSVNAAVLVRAARRDAALTQAQLAERLGMTQAGVARLERRDANPTVATLDRVLRAAGKRLELDAAPAEPQVDEAQIRAQLQLTPEERAKAHDRAYGEIADLVRAARRVS